MVLDMFNLSCFSTQSSKASAVHTLNSWGKPAAPRKAANEKRLQDKKLKSQALRKMRPDAI